MKKFLFSISLLFLGICMAKSQMIKFEAPDKILEGPYIELNEDGYNLYSWYKKTGYKSKKLGGFSSGDAEIQVTMLEIQRFDAQGKFLETETHAVQLDEGNGLVGKYEIHDKPVMKSGRKVFATGDDLTFRELVKKFPKSRDHSGAGVKEKEKVSYTLLELTGKGLLGGKKPYSLNVEKSDEGGNAKVELADIDAGDPKAEWKTKAVSYAFVGDEKIILPTWYQRYEKKDRFNYLRNYKLAAYDEQGKMVVETDVTFDVPNELYRTMYTYDKAGKAQGLLYLFGEQYGMGWKKVNPEPEKDLNTLYWFDNDKLSEPIELRTSAKGSFPGIPYILKALSSDDGIRLFMPKYKNKKQGVTEDLLEEYLCKDGKSELLKSHKLADISKNSGGEVTARFIGSTQNLDKLVELSDGGTMYIGYTKTKSDAGITYGDCLYLTTNSDGTIRNIGRVESGARSNKSPRISLEKLDGDKVFIKINKRSKGTTLWIFNASTSEFTSVKPITNMVLKEVMRKDNTIYFIGVTNAEKREWVVEKFDL